MATATSSAADTLSVALKFEVYEENSGRYRWRITGTGGKEVATSCASFSSHKAAQRAAEHVCA
jgi:uncharacterized protein YegP (UPF0339 family)